MSFTNFFKNSFKFQPTALTSQNHLVVWESPLNIYGCAWLIYEYREFLVSIVGPNDALFVFSLLWFISSYMFRTLFAHHQEAMHTQQFVYFVHLLLLLSVGPAKSRLCTAPYRGLLCHPRFSSPVHLQRRPTSDGVRDLYQRKWGIMGEKFPVKFSLTMRLPHHCRVL
jgi:hypothetical protein